MFDQFHLPLFTPTTPASPARRAAAAQRERSYDEAILRYVGYFRAATVHQVLFRFFIFAGKGPRYGFKAVRRLINEGLLMAKPLDPTKGTVSRQVLTLSPSGWQLLGLPQPKDPWRVAPETLLHYRLQFAEMMLVRATEGWILTREEDGFETLRASALTKYRVRPLNEAERQRRDLLERMAPLPLKLRVLSNPKTGDARLILPVRRGKSYTATIDELPSLAILLEAHFEIVCSDPELADKATDYLRRWGETHRTPLGMHQVPFFRSRPHPAAAGSATGDLYARHDVQDPRHLI